MWGLFCACKMAPRQELTRLKMAVGTCPRLKLPTDIQELSHRSNRECQWQPSLHHGGRQERLKRSPLLLSLDFLSSMCVKT
jgi:hypothetical protein